MTPKHVASRVQEHLVCQRRSHLAAAEWVHLMRVLSRLAARHSQCEVFVSTTLDVREGEVIACQQPAFVHETPGPVAPRPCI